MLTRDEHIAACKQRALELLDTGAPSVEALTSMFSDLDRHDETRGHIGVSLGMQMLIIGALSTEAAVRRFIEGFR